MKPVELLNSLDHIGEDLLAEAEQNVLSRTKRPWLKTAVAAVLVAAVGIGGFLTLKHFTMRSSIQATQPVVTDPVTTDESLPMLTVGDSWAYLPGQLTYLFGSGPSLCDSSITKLPVYSSQITLTPEINAVSYYSQEQLTSILESSVRRLGLEMNGPIEYTQDGTVFRADVETSIGTLAAFGDGELCLYFGGRQKFDESSEDLVPLSGSNFSAAAKSVIRRDHDLLEFSEDDYILYDTDNWHFLIFPAAEDPAKQLLYRSFGCVTQTYSSDGLGDILCCNQRPGSDRWYDIEQDWRISVGNYPLISLDEAKELVLDGYYYCLYDVDQSLTENLLSEAALVYPTNNGCSCFMPFYRFLISSDDSTLILSVPAVRSEYLSDFPVNNNVAETEQSEPVVSEPISTETPLETTEPNLSLDYFTELYRGSEPYFSNAHTEIWMQNHDVLKKNLDSGEVETLFTLAPEEGIQTSLVGVTENRLYFGWNNADDWWGVYVYSVDYHGEDRTEIATTPQELHCKNGWIYMESFHTDVRQYTLKVIDHSDKTVVDIEECWAHEVVNNALYYIYVPALQDWDEFGMENSERDALVQHVQYAVCRVDVDRSITTLGVIDQDYDLWNDYHCNFPSIDADHQEIIFYNEKAETITRLDLSTMQMKAKTVWSIGEQTISHLIEDYVNLEFAAVPYLNADTSGADSINAEIREKFDYLKKDLISSRERPAYHVCYEVYLWNNVVSIIIKTHTDSDFTDYAVYCYDNSTGLRLDTAALLEKMGISQDDFLAECKTQFVQKFEEDNAYMDEQTREASGYEKELARQKEYVRMDLMAYPNQDGQLVVVAPIATFAGAGYCYTPLVLNLSNAN